MNEHAAEYQYTFTMSDGEAFGITVQQQSNGRWFVQAWDDKGEIIVESHDWGSMADAAGEAVRSIILGEEPPCHHEVNS